jgi:hypothetical protein
LRWREDLHFGQNLRPDAVCRDVHDLFFNREWVLDTHELSVAITHAQHEGPTGGVAERGERLQDRPRGAGVALELQRLALVPRK